VEAPDLGGRWWRLLRRTPRARWNRSQFSRVVAKVAKDNAKPKVIWQALGGPFKDYAAFLDALRTGKLNDGLDYGR
jgi:hypothetical protein